MTSKAKDRLIIRGLELHCVIGAFEWERQMPQRVVVDIELRGDFSAAAASDALADAVDYRTPCIKAAQIATETTYHLLETLADHIAQAVLQTHPSITTATISAHKPAALIGFGKATATVEVTRGR